MEVCNIVQEVVIKTILKKNICEEAKWLPEEALKIHIGRAMHVPLGKTLN